jgi:hypothetical protein
VAGLGEGKANILRAVQIVQEHDCPRLVRVVCCQNQELIAVSIRALGSICYAVNDGAASDEAAELAYHVVIVRLGVDCRGVDDNRAKTAVASSIWRVRPIVGISRHDPHCWVNKLDLLLL